MYGYIYITTNLVNGKKYIGQHRANEYDDKYFGSGSVLRKAIQKYGIENFINEILSVCETEEELNEQEIYFIQKYKATDNPDFYNLCSGGYLAGTDNTVWVYNDETKESSRIPESKLPQFLELGFQLGGPPRTEEQRQHYSQGRKDLVVITDGTVTRYVNKNQVQEFLNNGFHLGRIPTRPNQSKEHRKWVNNGKESLMVKEEDINKYLELGYVQGRLKFKTFNRVQPAHNKGKKKVETSSGCHYI